MNIPHQSRPTIVGASIRIAAPPERIWPLLTDSHRFNRHLGLIALKTALGRDKDNLNLPTAAMQIWGITISRQSDPVIEWEHPRWFRRMRVFTGSPWISIESVQRIGADGGETSYEMRFTPQWWLRPFMPIGKVYIGWRMRSFLAEVARNTTEAAVVSHWPLAVGHDQRANSQAPFVLDRFKEWDVDRDLLGRLLVWMEGQDDRSLRRIRPLRLAAELGADRGALLRIFLVGNRVGLFDLNWDLVCPSCRGVTLAAKDLKLVKPGYHCDTCRLDLTANFDEALEVTFAPSPLLRTLTDAEFCYGYPAQTPHVLAQLRLEAGEGRATEIPAAGRVHYWVLPQQLRGEVEIASSGGQLVISGAGVTFVPGDSGQVAFDNQSGGAVMIQLQQALQIQECLTAARLTTLQDFRDLLASQLLSSDVSLGIRLVTVLFTDLKGSTAMYAEIGDAPAFERVKRHFDILREVLRRHEGGLVKTIGDSVMAVFSDPARAVEAAAEMSRRVKELDLTLKVGIHAGPCIAINQNDILDYFGTTVNLAARIEALSKGDIVISAETTLMPGVAEVVDKLGMEITTEEASVKGIDRLVSVARLALV